MSTFGERFKKLRIEHNKTLDEMKDILHTTKATLSRYENSKLTPKIDFAKKAAEYFGVTTDYILGYEFEQNNSYDIAKSIIIDTVDFNPRDHLDNYICIDEKNNTSIVDIEEMWKSLSKENKWEIIKTFLSKVRLKNGKLIFYKKYPLNLIEADENKIEKHQENIIPINDDGDFIELYEEYKKSDLSKEEFKEIMKFVERMKNKSKE